MRSLTCRVVGAAQSGTVTWGLLPRAPVTCTWQPADGDEPDEPDELAPLPDELGEPDESALPPVVPAQPVAARPSAASAVRVRAILKTITTAGYRPPIP